MHAEASAGAHENELTVQLVGPSWGPNSRYRSTSVLRRMTAVRRVQAEIGSAAAPTVRRSTCTRPSQRAAWRSAAPPST